MPTILMGVGSNLGDRESILGEAVSSLRTEFDVISVSDWFTYPAVGGPDGQHDFLNGAVLANTSFDANEVCEILHRIEREAGRTRIVRWSSRTLDCDLLLYGSQQIWTPSLKVPHPRMATRRFVLQPANEIACDMVHPESGWTIGELFLHLKSAEPYFCIIGSDRAKAAEFAKEVAEEAGCTVAPRKSMLESSKELVDAGDRFANALEWQRSLQQSVVDVSQRNAAEHRAIVSSNWDFEPWLVEPTLSPPEIDSVSRPKLLVVLDDKLSEYGDRVSKIDERFRIPTLFLSQDPTEALQDAVGAVLGMTM